MFSQVFFVNRTCNTVASKRATLLPNSQERVLNHQKDDPVHYLCPQDGEAAGDAQELMEALWKEAREYEEECVQQIEEDLAEAMQAVEGAFDFQDTCLKIGDGVMGFLGGGGDDDGGLGLSWVCFVSSKNRPVRTELNVNYQDLTCLDIVMCFLCWPGLDLVCPCISRMQSLSKQVSGFWFEQEGTVFGVRWFLCFPCVAYQVGMFSLSGQAHSACSEVNIAQSNSSCTSQQCVTCCSRYSTVQYLCEFPQSSVHTCFGVPESVADVLPFAELHINRGCGSGTPQSVPAVVVQLPATSDSSPMVTY